MSAREKAGLGQLYTYPFEIAMPLTNFLRLVRLLRLARPETAHDQRDLAEVLGRTDLMMVSYLESYMEVLEESDA